MKEEAKIQFAIKARWDGRILTTQPNFLERGAGRSPEDLGFAT
jgi:hypothetical protein